MNAFPVCKAVDKKPHLNFEFENRIFLFKFGKWEKSYEKKVSYEITLAVRLRQDVLEWGSVQQIHHFLL